MQKRSGEVQWINAAKFVAILAVMTDHTHQRLYTDYRVAWASYFSVTVFVFLSGMTSFYSCHKHKDEPVFREIVRRIGNILLPYAAATFFYQLSEHHFWDFGVYVDYLLNFNASGPFYFVAFYIQLVAVSPFFYRILSLLKGLGRKSYRGISYGLSVGLMILAAGICCNYTCIKENYYGGSKYLLGGSYLLVFYMGMLFAGMEVTFRNIRQELFHTVTSGICMVGWHLFTYYDRYGIDRFLPFGGGSNPPGITLIVYGCLVVWFCFSLFSLMGDCRNKWAGYIAGVLNYCGKYSLYMFLYHRLMLDYLLPRIDLEGIIKVILYFAVMVAVPIGMKMGYDMLWSVQNNRKDFGRE